MAGYSGTPLEQKLGLTRARNVAVIGGPEGFALDLPDVTIVHTDLASPPYDVVLWFLTSRDELAHGFVDVASKITREGGVWLAWPKKASKVPTDVTEHVLREIGLPHGLVDNKVCAIDERWSGLRFVWRKEKR